MEFEDLEPCLQDLQREGLITRPSGALRELQFLRERGRIYWVDEQGELREKPVTCNLKAGRIDASWQEGDWAAKIKATLTGDTDHFLGEYDYSPKCDKEWTCSLHRIRALDGLVFLGKWECKSSRDWGALLIAPQI